jgi:hypothetical protein
MEKEFVGLYPTPGWRSKHPYWEVKRSSPSKTVFVCKNTGEIQKISTEDARRYGLKFART